MGDLEGCLHRSRAARTDPAWSLFLRSQAQAVLACDFFTAEPLNGT